MLLPKEVGGGALFESNVIVRYLARKHAPELLGDSASAEAAARADVWMDWQTAGSWRQHAKGGGKGPSAVSVLHDNVVRLPFDRRMACEDILVAAKEGAEALSLLEAQLGKAPFLGGDRFTIADIPMVRWRNMGRVGRGRMACIRGGERNVVCTDSVAAASYRH